MLMQKKKEGVVFVRVGDLIPNPMQPRLSFSDAEIQSLADSIKRYGIISPIAVRQADKPVYPGGSRNAGYEIIAGERRWRAAVVAGLEKVPCVVIDADREKSAALALVENQQRSDLSFFEEAIAIQNLLLLTGQTQTDTAKQLSISQSTLCNKLRLLKLTDRERLLITENGLSERHARALVRIGTERERRALLLKMIECQLSAPESEKLVEDYLSGAMNPRSRPEKKKPHGGPKTVKGSIKDIKFLYNTVERAVDLLNSSGLNAMWNTVETETETEIKITLKKARQ